jgi:hypothetical protein
MSDASPWGRPTPTPFGRPPLKNLPAVHQPITVITTHNEIIAKYNAGEAHTMRDWVRFVKTKWGGGVVVKSSNGATSRRWRLIARAYADVYGLNFTDEDEQKFEHSLTTAELSCLPELRRRIRAYHKDTNMFSFLTLRGKLLLSAFSISSLMCVVALPYFHDYVLYIIFCVFFVAITFCSFLGFEQYYKERASKRTNANNEQPADQIKKTYHRKSDTVYGDARVADDWEIDEALRDKTGGLNPIFRD